MTEDELITRMELGTLTAEEFHHADHVRLAWAYLQRDDYPHALWRFIRNLKAFASRMGRPGRYHETITCAWVTLIHQRDRASGGFASWEEFARANEDLMEGPVGVLANYYRAETLASPLARVIFLLPDGGLTAPISQSEGETAAPGAAPS
jgi:hypothetical protein